MSGIQYFLLGQIAVQTKDGKVSPGGVVACTLLAELLFHADKPVTASRLSELAWGDTQVTAERLYVAVSRLRKLLRRSTAEPPATIERTVSGYLLRVPPEHVDLRVFESQAALGRDALARGDAATAAGQLRAALDFWPGIALEGASDDYLDVRRQQLDELRLSVLEDRFEADLLLGRHTRLTEELHPLVTDHPLRERLRAQFMLALYRSGRQAEALAVYDQTRKVLADQLGVDPGPDLQRLHTAILRNDPGLLESTPAAGEPITITTAAVPAELPADIVDFTGRDRELRELNALAGEGSERAVVITAITGTAGAGKTALAIHWAHGVSDRFPDGQLYVNLRGFDFEQPMRPLEALSHFLRSFGVATNQVPVDENTAAAKFRSLLAGKRVLILLDNARSAEHVRPLLPGTAGPLILITSRDRLTGLAASHGARRLALDVLPAGGAVTLITRMLGEQRLSAEPEAAKELARACGRLPLALRIAAANLADQPHRQIADYVAALRGRNRLSTLATAEERTTIRTVFDQSYTTLDPLCQRVFRLLGLVPGPDFTVDVTAALADVPSSEAERMLRVLANAHLVDECSQGRYGFHDLLRAYAFERAQDEDSDSVAASERLFLWYSQMVDAAGRRLFPEKLRLRAEPGDAPRLEFTDRTSARAWLDAERVNLVSAVHHANAHGPANMAWLLADGLRGYFWMGSFVSEWLDVAHAGLSAARRHGALAGEAASMISIAAAQTFLGRYPQAIDTYEQALVIANKAEWLDGQAAILGSIGITHSFAGQPAEAIRYLIDAVAACRERGWAGGVATGLSNLGWAYRMAGQLGNAREAGEEARSLFRNIGSLQGEELSLRVLARVEALAGNLGLAMELTVQGMSVARDLGDRYGEVIAGVLLAQLHRDARRLDFALDSAQQASRRAAEIGEPFLEADAHRTLASVKLLLGEHGEAIDLHRRALRLASDAGAGEPMAEAMIALANALVVTDRLTEARVHAESALEWARRSGYLIREGEAHTLLSRIDLAQDRRAEAISHAKRALTLHRRTGFRLGEARALVVLGHDVAKHRDTAMRIFADLGLPVDV